MSVDIQSMARFPLNCQSVTDHKSSTTQITASSSDFIGVREANIALKATPRKYSEPSLPPSRQHQQQAPQTQTRGGYEKYSRTKQRGGLRSNKRRSSSLTSSRSKDTENRDPEAIRRLSVKYASTTDAPIAPPTTPVLSQRLEFLASPRHSVSPGGDPRAEARRPSGEGPERCESRQSKYHEECTPKIDPDLVIGSRSRRDKLNSARSIDSARRRRPSSLASTSSSLLTHRESVVNLVYSGTEGFDESSDTQWFQLPPSSRRASTVFTSLASLTASPDDVMPGDYDVIQQDDCSKGRWCRNRSMNSLHSISSERLPQRSGFLYQMVSFDNLSHAVPPFVKNNVQKNGRLVTESFILKVNYLRRRRAVGDLNNSGTNSNTNNRKGKNVKESKTGRTDQVLSDNS